MTGVSVVIPRIQLSDALGKPVAKGLLYTFVAGATTKADTFKDQALTVKNTNPIVLDDAGSCMIWLDPSKQYKFDLRSKGVTQDGWPVDNVSGAATAVTLAPVFALYAKKSELAAQNGSSLVGFIQAGSGSANRTVQDKLRERVSIDDFYLAADADALPMILRALNSGAKRVVGSGKSYAISGSVLVPGGVTFDGEGGELRISGSLNGVVTGGTDTTICGWSICSATPGVRKGFYGLLVAHARATVRDMKFKDITYTGLFNDADGTMATNIRAENCGWDAVSNYTNSRNSTFRNVVGIRNGRSLFSTDAGAKGIVLDGFEAVDNGLDEIGSEHKDVLHFEYATDCLFRNGVIRYTAGYAGGTIGQTWAMMRWNASVNCHIENVEFKIESSVHGRLLLGLFDSVGADHNTRCSARNINVDASAIPGHKLIFLAYDGAAFFRLTGGVWNGYCAIESGVAGGNAFENISDLDVTGPGAGSTFLYSQYNTLEWMVRGIKVRNYAIAFNLNGFVDSTIRDCEITNATDKVFFLTATNASYRSNGGAVMGNLIRGTTGTVLNTNGQTTHVLSYSGNVVDGDAAVGLDCGGGPVYTNRSLAKPMGNLVRGTLAVRMQNGTNSYELDDNMNYLPPGASAGAPSMLTTPDPLANQV